MTDIIFPKIHTEGYKFLAIAILITIFLYFFSGFLGLVSLVLTIWVYYFFRDPERVSINDDNYLVSPADGSVVQVQETNGPKELNLESKKFTKVSIFMNVFDCHVNRIPCDGKISEIIYSLYDSLQKVYESLGAFYNEVFSDSLFDEKKIFIVKRATDKLIKILEHTMSRRT